MSDIPKPVSNADNQLRNYGNPEELKPKSDVHGTIIEQSRLKKLGAQFFKRDMKSIVDEEIDNVFIPFVKDTILGFISQLLYGDSYHRGNSYYSSSFGRRDYSGISSSSYRNNNGNRNQQQGSIRSMNGVASVYDYKTIAYDTEFEANEVLSMMRDYLDQYPNVKVADFYELSHPKDFKINQIDYDFGWTDLSRAMVVPINTPEGRRWVIDLPRAVQL